LVTDLRIERFIKVYPGGFLVGHDNRRYNQINRFEKFLSLNQVMHTIHANIVAEEKILIKSILFNLL
jgi:hypothetical protein